jgi:hypothetical protein
VGVVCNQSVSMCVPPCGCEFWNMNRWGMVLSGVGFGDSAIKGRTAN